MKVLICGGRNVGRTNPNATHRDAAAEITRASKEKQFVNDYLTKLHQENNTKVIIAGDEGGAERIGLHWALVNKIAASPFKRINSKETTIARNSRMLAESKPDIVIAFGNGESTTQLLKEAKEKGIQVIEIKIPEF